MSMHTTHSSRSQGVGFRMAIQIRCLHTTALYRSAARKAGHDKHEPAIERGHTVAHGRVVHAAAAICCSSSSTQQR